MKTLQTIFILYVFFFGTHSSAGEADVINVEVSKNNGNNYSFSVTVLHEDTGWKHYADKWDIIDEKGAVLGTRILHHPHVGEQPFTRNLSGVEIPEDKRTVTIRAHDSVHKYGGKVLSIELP